MGSSSCSIRVHVRPTYVMDGYCYTVPCSTAQRAEHVVEQQQKEHGGAAAEGKSAPQRALDTLVSKSLGPCLNPNLKHHVLPR
jgi:hypothetical protein